MFAIQTNNKNIFSLFPSFLLAVAISANVYLFLHFKFHPLDDHLLLVGASTAILAMLFIASLVSRPWQQGENRDPELEPNNKATYTGAIRQDTGSHKKNAPLGELQNEWEETFNTITDFISIHDKDFRITKANKSLCEFLGKPREEIISIHCYQLFHNANEPVSGCPHVQAIDTGLSISSEIHDPNFGFPLQITCSPFFDEEGLFKGSVHIARIVDGPCKPPSETIKPNLIAICASCKNIRDSKGIWRKIEEYIPHHHGDQCTHSICQECQQKLYPRFTR